MKKKTNKKIFFEKVVTVFKTKAINNQKGNLYKFVDIKSNFFKGFGEIYFTEIKKNKIKGWKKHKKKFLVIKSNFRRSRVYFLL